MALGRHWASEQGVKLFLEYGRELISDNNIVSVGCGSGKYEKMLDPDERIICVDPNPLYYREEKEQRKINYKYTKELITDKPDIIGNCSLMLIWPFACLDDRSEGYDIDTITQLKPIKLMIIYDATGFSGSPELAKSIERIGGPTYDNQYGGYGKYEYHEIRGNIFSDYKIIKQYCNEFVNKNDNKFKHVFVLIDKIK